VKRILAVAIALLACACSSRAQNTYTWDTGGFAPYDRDTVSGNPLSLTVPANVTVVNITASTDDTSPCGDSVNSYSLTSGPAPQIGEWAQVQGIPAGFFKIIDVGTDAEGNPTFTLSDYNCESGPHSGTAFIGPSFNYYLHFTSGVCDGRSSVTAGFFDANGVLQSAPSATGSVTCSTTSPDGGFTHVTKGSFSGTDSTGQPFTATFTVTDKNGRFGRYAQSAQWYVGAIDEEQEQEDQS
jgi:hypothetical protein